MINEKNKVLVVDDEPIVCDGCKRIFEEEGYIIKFALSGKEGLEKAKQEVFDVVLVDLKMPDISGMEVIKSIKQEQPDVAVIMITGYASVPTAVEAMKLGAEEYIPKPFTPDEILTVVSKAMERVKKAETENGMTVEKDTADARLYLKIVERAACDEIFLGDLFEKGTCALKEYDLSIEAKVAIVSGDSSWFEQNVAGLTTAQMEQLRCLLKRTKLFCSNSI